MSKTVVMTDVKNDITRTFTGRTEQSAWDKVNDWWPEFVSWHRPARIPTRDEYEWEVINTCAKGHREHYQYRSKSGAMKCRKCRAEAKKRKRAEEKEND